MAPPRGSAAYKKKYGILALSKDNQSVSWTPAAPPGSKPTLVLPVASITSKSTYGDGRCEHEINRDVQISSRRLQPAPR